VWAVATFGIDTGGTFTDLVRLDADGTETVHKRPSTPDDPGRAVLEALAAAGGAGAADHVVHGTTVALNALLTGRTARTALVTNTGFRDLIEIGRQTRPDLYALEPRRPRPLVPRELRFEVAQRSYPARAGDPTDDEAAAGPLVEALRPGDEELARLLAKLRRARVESVAVCLLHAYADPAIEERVARALQPLGVPITCSSTLLREHREFERFATAVVNAALVPLVRAYLGPLAERVAPARLSILQSSGGHLPSGRAGDEPVRVLTSGPAGGVVGAQAAARDSGHPELVALDMGGTSTDVACVRSGLAASSERDAAAVVTDLPEVGGHPIAVPSLDLHTIGCGGGSMVRLDAAGALHAGPDSAGAHPGPVAYGRSDVATVTDAHVLLGHVASGAFVGGELELDTDAVARAFEALGRKLGATPERTARAVLGSARAAMRRAIAAMTHQRGRDPMTLPLVAFGGAGGLHAAALAASLSMPCAIVPRHPGALSAWGMTRARARREAALSVLVPLANCGPRERARRAAELVERVRAELAGDPGSGRIHVTRSVDLRYRGQAYELRLPDGPGLAEAFHTAHTALYGHRFDDDRIEVVRLRVVAERGRDAASSDGSSERPAIRRRRAPAAAHVGRRAVRLDPASDRVEQADLWLRDGLREGHELNGPAVVQEYSGTTLVPAGWTARVTRGAHLELRAPRSNSGRNEA
jgi:N-methylhydantoinase A